MKKQIFAFIFALGTFVAVGAVHTYAQSPTPAIKIEIPFAFVANNKTLPAGTYRIESAADNRIMWRIQNADASQFLLARNLSGTKDDDKLRVTFHRYGEQSFLVGFKTPSYEVDLPTSSIEKSLRRSRNDVAKYDEVNIETTVAQK